MKEDKEIKQLPPYVPYKTFTNFLDRLKVGIPGRIDRSIMPSTAPAIQGQLINALVSLQLISNDGTPTEKLQSLVVSQGEERKVLLKQVVIDSYPFLFKPDLHPSKMTAAQLQEAFTKVGASGETARKCIYFFRSACEDAGIELSPHLNIKKSVGQSRRSRKFSPNNTNKQPVSPEPHGVSDPENKDGLKHDKDWNRLLLEKFPEFDPKWPDDLKTKWFEDFDKLLSRK